MSTEKLKLIIIGFECEFFNGEVILFTYAAPYVAR